MTCRSSFSILLAALSITASAQTDAEDSLLVHDAPAPQLHWADTSAVRSDTVMRHALQQMGIHFTTGNTVELITTGQRKFQLLFEDIRRAQQQVNLEYFNFRNDSIGNALFDILGEKAAQGVAVNAMFDSFGNKSNDAPLRRRHLRNIRATGIDVRVFDPLRFPWINHAYHRDHRKVVVIDHSVCYTGGMNVADYYIHGRPRYGQWRDMHMRLTGPVVAAYDTVFTRMWHNSFGQPPADAADSTFNLQTHLPWGGAGGGPPTATIGVVDRRPGRHSKLMRQAYVAAIDAAQRHIQIVNPYPTNVKSVRRALRRALQRGVDVEIMVSSKSDVPITPDVVALEMKKLAKRGARVYYNTDGFYHSKTMVIDSLFCTIGSTNLDARSFLYDYEVNSFIIDTTTCRQLLDIFDADRQTCIGFTHKDYRRRFNFGHRLLGHLFSLFRGFL